MVLRVHGPCTETVRALAGFKLSARGVQTQHVVPPPAVHCPPTPNATCLARSPHHRAALAAFALARRRSPSPHACLTHPPHHHAALVAFALARRRSPSPHACLTRSPHGGWGGRWWVHDGGYMTSGWGDSTRQTMAVTE